MSGFQQKITRHAKGYKSQFEEIEQAPEPNSDMADILELSAWEFEVTMINVL